MEAHRGRTLSMQAEPNRCKLWPGHLSGSADGAGHDAAARRDRHRGHHHALVEAGGRPIAVDDVLFEVSTDKVDTEVPSAFAGFLRASTWPRATPCRSATPVAVITARPTSRSRRAADAAPSGAAPAEPAPDAGRRAHARPPRPHRSPGRPARPTVRRSPPVVRRLLDEHGLRRPRSSAPAATAASPAPTCWPRRPTAPRLGRAPATVAARARPVAAAAAGRRRGRAHPGPPDHGRAHAALARHRRPHAGGDRGRLHRRRPRCVERPGCQLPAVRGPGRDRRARASSRTSTPRVGDDRADRAPRRPPRRRRRRRLRGARRAGRRTTPTALRLRALADAIADLADRARAQAPHRRRPRPAARSPSPTSGAYGTLVTAPDHQPAAGGDPLDRRRADAPGRRAHRRRRASGTVAVHPVGNLSLSFDHRAVDGAYASAFLARVRDDARDARTGHEQ